MRPGEGLRTTTRVARKSASSTLCVIISAPVRLSSQILSSSSCMRSRVMASSAPSGSSISRNRGSAASARAIPTRWRMPPDSVQIGLAPCPWRPTRLSSASARRRRSSPERPLSCSGRATLSRVLSQAKSASSWNTTARSAEGPVRTTPSMLTCPAVGATKPAATLSRLVLPEPERPSTATKSPAARLRLTRSSTAGASRPAGSAAICPRRAIRSWWPPWGPAAGRRWRRGRGRPGQGEAPGCPVPVRRHETRGDERRIVRQRRRNAALRHEELRRRRDRRRRCRRRGRRRCSARRVREDVALEQRRHVLGLGARKLGDLPGLVGLGVPCRRIGEIVGIGRRRRLDEGLHHLGCCSA